KPERPYDGSLELGAGGEVYLVADRDLVFDGLALSVTSSDDAALQWSGLEPGLKDPGLPGVLSLAFLDRVQIGGGERFLLGQVTGGAHLHLSGVSAHSGPSDIRLRVPTVRPQSVDTPQ